MMHSHKCKLTEERVEEIYVELREGTAIKEIALMFDVSRCLIEQVNNGITWVVEGFDYPIYKRKKMVKVSDKSYEYPIEDCYPCNEWEKGNGRVRRVYT